MSSVNILIVDFGISNFGCSHKRSISNFPKDAYLFVSELHGFVDGHRNMGKDILSNPFNIIFKEICRTVDVATPILPHPTDKMTMLERSLVMKDIGTYTTCVYVMDVSPWTRTPSLEWIF